MMPSRKGVTTSYRFCAKFYPPPLSPPGSYLHRSADKPTQLGFYV